MHPEIDLRIADFRGLSLEQHLAKCRAMAREAERLASNGNDAVRADYSDLARRWCDLAYEIEHDLTSQKNRSME